MKVLIRPLLIVLIASVVVGCDGISLPSGGGGVSPPEASTTTTSNTPCLVLIGGSNSFTFTSDPNQPDQSEQFANSCDTNVGLALPANADLAWLSLKGPTASTGTSAYYGIQESVPPRATINIFFNIVPASLPISPGTYSGTVSYISNGNPLSSSTSVTLNRS